MRNVLTATAIATILCLIPAIAASADANPPTPSISVSATGSVTYTPDLAHVSLGVRAEAREAADAAAAVNERAQKIIAAMRRLGIPDRALKTSSYNLEYQEPPRPPPPMVGEPLSVAARGRYVATETIDVKSRVDKAGAVIDAGVGAGANLTYGLSFDTSQRDMLYRRALTRAIADARAQAAQMAAAAGVRITGIMAINAGGPPPIVYPMARLALEAAPAPPIQAGTDTITASVQMVFRFR